MAGVKIGGGSGGGLNFTGTFNIDQIKRNAAEAENIIRRLTITANGINNSGSNNNSGTFNTRPLTQYQEANLRLRQILIQGQAEAQRLRNDTLALNQAYAQGRINAQQMAAAERQARADRRALADAAREARQSQVAANGSYDEAVRRLKELGRAIRSAEGGFESTSPAIRAQIQEYNQLNARLREFDAQMGNHQRNVGNYRSALDGIVGQLKSMAVAYLSLNAALLTISAVVKANVEISDSMSDVRRTAGLTSEEVEGLVGSLKKIDTRTSLKGLLDIAVIGGQLGISKDQLGGFTKAIDQLAVSLGGELQGGAEGVAKSLGVLDNVFKVTQGNGGDVEKSFNQIGSAILGLGQSGLATGDFLADFGERVGGIGKQAGLSLPVILSYGAVLQENGVSAEVAGSSFKKLISLLATRRNDFFAVAHLADSNLTLKDFTHTINTDTQRALELFFAGLRKGGGDTTAFLDILKSTGLAMSGVSQTVAALSNGQESLNGHIADATRDFDNATLSAEQFAIKNDNLAGTLEKVKNELINAGTAGRTGGFLKGVADAVYNITHGITTLVNSDSWGEFWERLTTFGKENYALIDVRKGITNNYQQSSTIRQDFTKTFNPIGASDSIVQSALADKSTKELKDLISKYSGAAKQAADALNAYKKGVRNGTIGDGGAVTVAQAEKNFTGLQKTLNLLSAAYVQARDKAQKANKEIAGSGVTSGGVRTESAIKAQIKQLQDDNKELAITSEQFKKNAVKIKALQKELRLANGGTDVDGNREKKQFDSALKSRNDLQDKISALTKKGTDKQLSADEQEAESVRKKYADMRKAAVEFNNDPKNKAKGLRVNTSGLASAESREQTAVLDKQATERLKITLDQQKTLYADYESYKTQVGQEQADKRYQNEVETGKSYLEYLRNQREKLAGDDKAKGADGGQDAATYQLQLKLLDERIAAEVIANKKKDDEIFASAYRNALTHKQALEGIDREYYRDLAALGANATDEQKANLAKQREAAVRNVNTEYAYRLSGQETLFANLDAMTRKRANEELDKAIAVYKKQYDAGKLSAKDYYEFVAQLENKKSEINKTDNNPFAKLSKSIKDYKKQLGGVDQDSVATELAQSKMFDSIAEAAAAASQVIGDVAGSLQELGIGGQGLQDALKGVGGILDGASGIAKGLATGNPIDVVTGSIKLLTSAVGLFSTKDKKLQKQIDGYKAQLDSLGKAYAQLDRQVANAVGNDIYSDQAAQIANLQQQQKALTAMRDAEASKKKKDQGKIDEYNNQIADIPNKIADINAAISQNLIQGTFRDLSNAIADVLTSAWQANEDGIAAMDKSFDAFIANAIKNGLKLKFLDPIVADFTNQLTDYAKGNGNSIIGFDFTAWKKKLNEAGAEFNAALKESGEFFPQDKAASTTTARGEVGAAITEDTASRSYGVWVGTQVGVLQTRDGVLQSKGELVQVRSLMTTSNNIAADMLQSGVARLRQLEMIQVNTANAVDRLDAAIIELQKNGKTLSNIEINSKSTGSLRGAGLG